MAATDEKAIHEFPTGTIDDNSLLIMDRPTSTPGEYETEKFAIVNLGLKLLGGIDFPSNLDTDEQDIFGAINEVNAKAMNISDEYDETESYSKGDYCIYQNAAYRCVKASGTTTGTFVAADWTLVKVLDEIKTNTDTINELNSSIGADLYNSSVTYNKGDYCIYNNTLYKCNTNNTTGTWNAQYWDATSVAKELNELNSGKQDAMNVINMTSTIRLNSNCALSHGYVSRYGRIVDFGLVLKVTGNINNNDVLIYGLPRANNNSRCPRGLSDNQYYANDFTSGGLAIDQDENDPTLAIVRNFSNITATTSSPKYIFMCFSYLSMN